MRKGFAFLCVVGVLTGACGPANAGEQDKGEIIINRIVADMWTWSKEAFLIEALETARRENRMSLEEIMEKDHHWRQTKGVTPFVQQFLSNDLAHFLQGIQADSDGLYAEVEITDQKGVIVAETSKTSDYYQADEAWWIQTYNGGKGATFRSRPQFDESSRAYVIDLCVPVYDREGKDVIGIIKAGVSIMKLAALQ